MMMLCLYAPQHNIPMLLCYSSPLYLRTFENKKIRETQKIKIKEVKKEKKNRVIIKYTHFVRVGKIIYER
jgi:hypothetical protein